jgi:ADP-ribose pyrophosphatase
VQNSIPIKDAWQHCPRCGKQVKTTGQQPFACDACGYSHYFSPCSAVAALIVDELGKMLFIVRGRDPGKGKLGLPGGFVDADESAEQALQREVMEELHLLTGSVEYLASFPNQYAYCGVIIPVTDLFFIVEVHDFATMAAQPGEVDGWTFLPVESVSAESLAFDTHQQALQAFRNRQRQNDVAGDVGGA